MKYPSKISKIDKKSVLGNIVQTPQTNSNTDVFVQFHECTNVALGTTWPG